MAPAITLEVPIYSGRKAVIISGFAAVGTGTLGTGATEACDMGMPYFEIVSLGVMGASKDFDLFIGGSPLMDVPGTAYGLMIQKEVLNVNISKHDLAVGRGSPIANLETPVNNNAYFKIRNNGTQDVGGAAALALILDY